MDYCEYTASGCTGRTDGLPGCPFMESDGRCSMEDGMPERAGSQDRRSWYLAMCVDASGDAR